MSSEIKPVKIDQQLDFMGQPVGGTCRSCRLTYRPGGAHLTDSHCLSEVKRYAAWLERSLMTLKTAHERSQEGFKALSHILYVLASKDPSGTIVVSQKEIEDVPNNASLTTQSDNVTGTITIQAIPGLTKPSA